MIKLVEDNIVVVAQNLNPSIFNQLWLVKQNIFAEEEIKTGSFFTPAAVNIMATDFDLLIVPERMQLTFHVHMNQSNIAKRIIGAIVVALPHTPYKALGFNFGWMSLPLDEKMFPNHLREIFVSPKNPLSTFFQEEDSRFGIYMSKNIDMMRLRLDIKPVTIFGEERKEALQFTLNFHKDLTEDSVNKILASLENWSSAWEISNSIVQKVSKDWT
ncbi:MAG TPA: hypothetical protein PLX02_02670 [Syntrophorhabdaceae bacterium]|nr:hypothetical protein [Syntrophorhabdaceae bacterium]